MYSIFFARAPFPACNVAQADAITLTYISGKFDFQESIVERYLTRYAYA
ncbi:hypothetical protein SynA18461_02262 [Synechococcus sp. A18-46.1]|nr:hypothetical protein SynA18461_02262 [Synechococcus sp. A18-46.1]